MGLFRFCILHSLQISCTIVIACVTGSYSGDKQSDQSNKQGGDPGDRALPENHIDCPFAAQFPLDGGDGSHAGSVQQAEYEKGGCSQGTHRSGEIGRAHV